MTLLSTLSTEGTVSRSICPAASRLTRGALRRARWTTYISKVDLVVWRRPDCDVCEEPHDKVLMLSASRGRHETCPASQVELS